jgi:LuxR family maltose regulon positive regulatory protein
MLHEQDLPGWHRYRGWALPAQDVDTPPLHGARLEIAAGHADSVIKILRRQLRQALARGRLRRALKARILLAWALWSAGKTAEACRTMGEALRYAEREGYVRTFFEEGNTVMSIVAQVCRTLLGEDGEPQGVARNDYLSRLLRALTPSTVIEPEAQQTTPITPLTRQERRVLELMADGLSNKDIALKLFVSEPTVKFHLRNILAKTATQNRTHAVATALRRGLIS